MSAIVENAQRIWAAGRPDDALAFMDDHLGRNPDDAAVAAAMADALVARHGEMAAIVWLAQCPALDAADPAARDRFLGLMRAARFVHRGPASPGDLQFIEAVGGALARLLEAGRGDWTVLTRPAGDLLRVALGGFGTPTLPSFDDLTAEDAMGILDSDPARAFYADRLLAAVMRHGAITAMSLEPSLAGLRMAALRLALAPSPDPVPRGVLDFFIRLARCAQFSEYLLPATAAEEAAIAAIGKGDLAAAAMRPDLLLPAAAAYAPLHAKVGDGTGVSVHPAFADLWREQVVEPARERILAQTIETVSAPAEDVSRAVQRQYEENPYPRWKPTPPGDPPRPLAAVLGARFPDACADMTDAGAPADVLIAGCGTGRQAVDAARTYAPAAVVAVDISRASLAYARRVSEEAGVLNIRYAICDVLAADRIGMEFDLIECVGVLHHLADPGEGLKRLARLLRPGGAIKLGLYSKTARPHIAAARAWIAAEGFGTSIAEIRRCRAAIAALPEDDPIRGTMDSADFYTASGCRDLIMHAHELPVDLADIRRWLAANGLTLLGFEPFASHHLRDYLAHNPHDPGLRDWEALTRFEVRHPTVFARMYVLWARRAA